MVNNCWNSHFMSFIRKDEAGGVGCGVWASIIVIQSLSLSLSSCLRLLHLQFRHKLYPIKGKMSYFLHRRWFLIGQHSLPGVPGDRTRLQSWTCNNIFTDVITHSSSGLSSTSHLKQFRWKSLPRARSFLTLVSPFLGTITLPHPPQTEQNFLNNNFNQNSVD